jgi:hypothetical protein
MTPRRLYFWLAALVAWWVAVSQVSRSAGPGARLYTEVGIGTGCVLIYLAAWAIAVTWSKVSPRH